MKRIAALAAALMLIPSVGSATTLGLDAAYSFQDNDYVGVNSTLVTTGNHNLGNEIDVTSQVSGVADGTYANAGTKTYFANGTSGAWLDAISLDFDMSAVSGGETITDAMLTITGKKGGYLTNAWWEHFVLLGGSYNPDFQDDNPGSAATDLYGGSADSLAAGTLISYSFHFDPSLLGTDGTLTLRLWNVAVDSLTLNVETVPTPVPEPGSLLLLGGGLLGLALLRRRKQF